MVSFIQQLLEPKTNLKIYWRSETMHDVVTGFATDESKRKSLEIVKTKLGKKLMFAISLPSRHTSNSAPQ